MLGAAGEGPMCLDGVTFQEPPGSSTSMLRGAAHPRDRRTSSASDTAAPTAWSSLRRSHHYHRVPPRARSCACQGGAYACASSGGAAAASRAASSCTVGTASCTTDVPETLPSSCGGDGVSSAPSQQHRHVGNVTEEAMQAFHGAMDLIDDADKVGYALAQTACPPSVLEHECCPCYFLVACDMNPWDGAARMCAYWGERIRLFEDRAFEALTLGSDVASPTGLTGEDVQSLETGSLCVLPCDRNGRSVIYYDDSALGPDLAGKTNSRLRVLWYILQAAYTSGEAQCHRMVIMFACYRPPLSGRYAASIWRFSSECNMFPKALPIVLDSLHLMTLSTKTGGEGLIKYVISAAVDMSGSYLSSFMRMHHGAANHGTVDAAQADLEAKHNLFQQLRELGFTKKGLPDFAGGLFVMEDFQIWARRRRRIEQRLFWTDEQRAQQKREVNRIHSRQKRRRRHDELERLKGQVTGLERKNLHAKITRDYLEQVLREANDAVEGLSKRGVDGNGKACESQPSASTDWIFEPFHDPHDSEGPASLGAFASLEPDPIATPSKMVVAGPSTGTRSFASWTTVKEPPFGNSFSANCVSETMLSLQRQLANADGHYPHNNMEYRGFPMTCSPHGEHLSSSAARGLVSLQPLTLDPGRMTASEGSSVPVDTYHWDLLPKYTQSRRTEGERQAPALLRDESFNVLPVRACDDMWTSSPAATPTTTRASFRWLPDVDLCRSVSLASPGDPATTAACKQNPHDVTRLGLPY